MVEYWNDELNAIRLRFRLRLSCHPERDSSVALLLQNDDKRRVQNDIP